MRRLNKQLVRLATTTLDEFFAQTPDLPLMNMDEYRPVSVDSVCAVLPNDEPLDVRLQNSALVTYPSPDE